MEALTVIDEEFAGFVKADFQPVSSRLGVLSDNITVARFSLTGLTGGAVRKALLELHAVVDKPSYAGWKLWFNGFPLTKEFKPTYSTSFGGKVHALFLYDVTPVVRRDHGREVHKLVISNKGSTELLVSYVFISVQVEAPFARTKHRYSVFLRECNTGAPCTIIVPQCSSGKKVHMRINGFVRLPRADLSVRGAGVERVFKSPVNPVDMSLEECLGEELTIHANAPPGSFLLTSVHSFVSEYEAPLLDAEAETMDLGDKLRVLLRVVNRGPGKAEKVVASLLALGSPVYSKPVGELVPFSSFEDEILIDKGKGTKGFTLRLIWHELGELRFKDFKIGLG